MSERERLIELLKEIKYHPEKTCPRYEDKECGDCQYIMGNGECNFYARNADYLLDNGVIVPPCKVGDTVYVIPTQENGMSFIEPRKITYILESESDKSYCSVDLNYKRKGFKSKEYAISEEMFGKTVFLTKEAAEEALRGECEGK